MSVIRKIVVSVATLFLALSAMFTVTSMATANDGTSTVQADNDWHSPRP